jgi:hypothetical protein
MLARRVMVRETQSLMVAKAEIRSAVDLLCS